MRDDIISRWLPLILAGLFPPMMIVVINNMIGTGNEGAFIRFANATLTAYTLTSFCLLGALFFYADSRHRPLSPLVGMILATSVGAGLGWLMLSQGDILMENTSSPQAQAFTNVVHLLVIGAAMAYSLLLIIGLMLTVVTFERRVMDWEEE